VLHSKFSLWCGALGLASGLYGGCGGSSSETPFPLEPDPSLLRPGAPARARYVALPRHEEKPSPQGAAPSGQDLPSTWGSSPSESAEEEEPGSAEPELKNGR
jgi:hypothetical protein